MYLKKLYHTNKWWFAGVLLFIVMQLFLNAKQGVVFSPVYHYGMYSGAMLPQKEYRVAEIAVNGQTLRPENFTPAQWDKISYTIQLFNSQQAWNSQLWNNDIKRLLHVRDSSKYLNNISVASFNGWYKNYLKTILDEKVDSVAINFTTYVFDGNKLTKTPG